MRVCTCVVDVVVVFFIKLTSMNVFAGGRHLHIRIFHTLRWRQGEMVFVLRIMFCFSRLWLEFGGSLGLVG